MTPGMGELDPVHHSASRSTSAWKQAAAEFSFDRYRVFPSPPSMLYEKLSRYAVVIQEQEAGHESWRHEAGS